MPDSGGPAWVTFWDRPNKRVLILAARYAKRGGTFSSVLHDEVDSRPGQYDIWREVKPMLSPVEGEDLPMSGIMCVEVHLDDRDEPLGFPDHLLDSSVLSPMTLWAKGPEVPSFMFWS